MVGARRRRWTYAVGALLALGGSVLAAEPAATNSVAAAAPQQPPAGGTTPSTAAQTPNQPPSQNVLDLDLEALSRVNVRPQTTKSTPTGTGNVVTPATTDVSLPAASVGELLEQTAGVSLRRTSAINLDPRIRGFHSSQINASADGITQLKTRIDIDSLFSQIHPGIVESLEIIDGPYTSLYGPGFAFLVGEFLTPPRYPDGTQMHGSANVTSNSNGRQIYNFEHLWGGGPDWGYQLTYGLRQGNDYGPGNSGYDGKVPASYWQEDVFFAFSADPTAHTRIEFDYIRQDLIDVELPGVAYDIRHSQTDQYNVSFILQENHSAPEKYLLQFWSQRTPYHGDANAQSKRRTFSNVLIAEPFPSLTGGTIINHGIAESTGVRAMAVLGEKDTRRLSGGVDWRRQEMFYNEADFKANGNLAFGGNTFGVPRSSMEDFGIFAHYVDPITKQWTYTLGGRFDRTNPYLDVSSVLASLGPDFSAADVTSGFAEKTYYLGMGYAAAEYNPCTWLKFNGGLAVAMRNPNLAELYSTEPFVPLVRFGNSFVDGDSELAPETNLQFDIGAIATWKRGSARIRAFQCTIHNYIMPVPSNFSAFVQDGIATPENLHRNYAAFAAGVDTTGLNLNSDAAALAYRYANIDRATLWGGEMGGEYKLKDWLSLTGSLAYVQGTNHTPVRFDGTTLTLVPLNFSEPLPGIYPINSSVGIRFFEPRNNKWSFETVLRMVGRQNRVASSLAELPTAGFTVVGLHGSYQVNESVRLFSAIENLFDRPYTQHGSLAIVNPGGAIDFVKEPGFSWIVGLEARF